MINVNFGAKNATIPLWKQTDRQSLAKRSIIL